jgi:hypothetical protein
MNRKGSGLVASRSSFNNWLRKTRISRGSPANVYSKIPDSIEAVSGFSVSPDWTDREFFH